MKYYYRYLFGFIFILFLLIPMILGDNAFMLIPDNLELCISTNLMLIQSGTLFSLDPNAIVPQIMGGMPRVSVPTGPYITAIFFVFFKPFLAYLLNYLLVHIVAFVGMYLFLKRYIAQKEDDDIIAMGGALCFALLPLYSVIGLSIAGQPLLFFAFLNIMKNKDKYYDWLILILFPFYSLFLQAGIFLVASMLLLLIYNSYKTGRFNTRSSLSILLVFALYLIAEAPTVLSMFFSPGFVSHRTEWIFEHWPLDHAMCLAMNNFFTGHYAAESFHLYILIATVAALAGLYVRRQINDLLVVLLLVTLGISLWYGIFRWEGLYFLKEKYYLFKAFGWDRFNWMHPFLWYTIFALSLSIIKDVKFGKMIVVILILLQANFNFTQSDIQSQLEGSWNIMNNRPANLLTYKRFFSEKLFSNIKEYIGRPQNEYRVVSIGIAPAVSQYNGFYTLDGYLMNYPLAYKHKFRKIIEKELDKCIDWKEQFDKWGSRCLIFSNELQAMKKLNTTKNYNRVINNLQLNTKQLKDMGGEYIFSAVEIRNYKANNLQFLKVFEEKDSLWRIFLYKVK